MGHVKRGIGLAAAVIVIAAAFVPQLSTSTIESGSSVLPATGHTSAKPKLSKVQLAAALKSQPLRFEANEGQSSSNVRFEARTSSYTAFLTPTEAVLELLHAAPPILSAAGSPRSLGTPGPTKGISGAVVDVNFLHANLHPLVSGIDRLPGVANYLVGSDPKGWHRGVASFATVDYKSLYPGIDLTFSGGQKGALEYTFQLSPGSKPEEIDLGLAGAGHPAMSAGGTLLLHTSAGDLNQPPPTIYQLVGGIKDKVTGGYVLRSHGSVGFWLGPYDHSLPVVIDPALVYSTFLAGPLGDVVGDGDGTGAGIAVDSSGDAYVTGETTSPLFPTTSGAFGQTYPANSVQGHYTEVAYVTKLKPDGSGILYSTYLGGNGINNGFDVQGDSGLGIALDGADHAFVAGVTSSSDFPLKNAIQTTNKANPLDNSTGFVSELSADGSGLVYSTYLGGTNNCFCESANGIAVDPNGNATITGTTGSGDFPTTAGSFQSTTNGEYQDGASVASSNTYTSASAAFSSSDNGQLHRRQRNPCRYYDLRGSKPELGNSI